MHKITDDALFSRKKWMFCLTSTGFSHADLDHEQWFACSQKPDGELHCEYLHRLTLTLSVRHQQCRLSTSSQTATVFCDKTRPMPRRSNRTRWVDLRWGSGGGQSGPKRIWLKNRTECAAGLACHVTPGGLKGEGVSEPVVVIIGQLKLSVLHLIDDVLLLFGSACKNSSRLIQSVCSRHSDKHGVFWCCTHTHIHTQWYVTAGVQRCAFCCCEETSGHYSL